MALLRLSYKILHNLYSYLHVDQILPIPCQLKFSTCFYLQSQFQYQLPHQLSFSVLINLKSSFLNLSFHFHFPNEHISLSIRHNTLTLHKVMHCLILLFLLCWNIASPIECSISTLCPHLTSRILSKLKI
jgi:hypothetical protein